MSDSKIARICWNTYGWRKPSGRDGKSKDRNAYEHRAGFGHEEWLLDTTKVINGWHYAFLQPIGKHSSRYVGKTFNISLYSINERTKQRWWVGEIGGVAVIAPDESRGAFLAYRQNGWLGEMEEQVAGVGGDVTWLRETRPEEFAVIKFRPAAVDVLDTPLQFPRTDPVVRTARYVLLNKLQPPVLPEEDPPFEFIPGHRKSVDLVTAMYEEHSSEIDRSHNLIQNAIYQQLSTKFGKNSVGVENPRGRDSQIDLVLKESEGNFTFYEVKNSYSVKLCIREALGQLLEYSYYPDREYAKKLVIVSPNPITIQARAYLKLLRERFKLPLYYQRYDPGSGVLEDVLY